MLLRKITMFILGTVLMLTAIAGCAGSIPAPDSLPKTSAADRLGDAPSGETVTMKNGHVLFEIDTLTAHFTVTDLQNGLIYRSVPEIEAIGTSENDLRMQSELTLSYFTAESELLHMYSIDETEKEDGIDVRVGDNAVWVYYSFGDASSVLPPVFDQKTFQEKILGKLPNDSIRRRFERYYTLYSSEDKTGDFDQMLKKYPALANTPLYIISDLLSDVEKSETSEYIGETGFTADDYENMLRMLNMSDLQTEQSAGFVVPVEYRLNDDGFTAAVLCDQIEESSDEYLLQSLQFLEYFASMKQGDKGSFFIPDGCGTLTDFDSTQTMSWQKPFFGYDFTKKKETYSYEQQLNLPVFGISGDSGGVLAIVESGAENGVLNVGTSGMETRQNHIYTSFTVRDMDVTDIGTEVGVPVYNLYSKERLAQPAGIRFIMLDGNESGISGMAGRYRTYLRESGGFPKEIAGGAPLFLDYVCMITQKTSILGIPYTKKTVLSSFLEITDSVKRLQGKGVENIVVRLIGWSSGGVENSVYSSFQPDKKPGTLGELESLAEQLKTTGGSLYLDADVQFVSRTGGEFSLKRDAVHSLNRSVAGTYLRDPVTKSFTDELPRYAVSPIRRNRYGEEFLSSLKKRWEGNLPGISYGSAGKELFSDYTVKRNISRTQSAGFLKEMLESADEKGAEMMFDNGNIHVLPFSKYLTNVASVSSLADNTFKDVPFYQMAVHGSVTYGGIPENLSSDSKSAELRSAAYGAAPVFVCITKDDSLLSATPYETLWYSLSDKTRLDSIFKRWKSTAELQKNTEKSAISDFIRIEEDLSCTVYDNGTMVYVNYSYADKVQNGMTIPAGSFVSMISEG